MRSPLSAVRWILFGSFGFRIVSLGGQMLILRLLDREEFGVYQAIVLIHMMCLTILPFSLDTLVVREKLRQRRYVVGLSQLLAVTGAGLALLAILLSTLPLAGAGSVLARTLELSAEHTLILFLMPGIFLVQAAKIMVRSIHSARLEFRTISIGEFGNGVITWLGGAAAVLLVPTAWMLLAVYLLGEIFECLWMYRGQRFEPLRVLRPARWSVLRRLLGKHLRYCGFNSSNLTLNNVASMMPGVLFAVLIAKEATADFSVALRLLVLPTMLLAGALWRVAFPSISGVPEGELRRRCLSITGASAAYIAPTVIWFAIFAPTTVWVLAGAGYMETATPLVYWMSIYMILVAVYTPISSLDMIRDVPEVGLAWNLVYSAGRVGIIVYFAPEGLLATIAAMAIFSMAMWVVHIYILGILLRAPWRDFCRTPLRFLPMWILLAAGCWLCTRATDGHLLWGPALSAVPCLIYVGLLVRFFPAEGGLLRRFFRRHA